MELNLLSFTTDELAKFKRLNIEECQALNRWLQHRIQLLQNLPAIDKPVNEVFLSNRAKNVLMSHDLLTVKDVVDYGLDNICLLRGAGEKTVIEIKKAVMNLGI